MSVTIATLRCKVRIKANNKKSPLHREEKPVKPAQTFEMPVVMSTVVEKTPEKPHTYAPEQPNEHLNAAKVDPVKVADRVYELMKRDIQNARDRG